MNRWKAERLDEKAMRRAQERWDAVAKPLGSLGQMERMITRIAGIQGTEDVSLSPRCALVFCGDHGVVREGVAQSDSSVTARVARSIAEGTANVNLMAGAAGADVFAVDAGMAEDIDDPRMITVKQAHGTQNMAKGPAMSREQAERAVESGIALVGEMKARGYRMIAVGEMGIGNTTAASAAACALLGLPPEEMTGRGAGLDDAGLARKVSVIRRALAVNRPDGADALDVLSKVGGYELAAMTGAFLGGAVHRVPVVMDGVISCVSALAAVRLCPEAGDFLLPSHMSREPVARAVAQALGVQPVLHADMALGEGTGAVMLFPLLDMALRVYAGSHTFRALGMEAYTPKGGRG